MSKNAMTKQKFINQWLRHFAPELSKDQYKQYVENQYIWHVFSFNLIESDLLRIGDAARQAFDQIEKNDCVCCDIFGDGVMNKLPMGCDTAEKIEGKFSEFYVVAKDYSWTYIQTHERDSCGPYFLKATK